MRVRKLLANVLLLIGMLASSVASQVLAPSSTAERADSGLRIDVGPISPFVAAINTSTFAGALNFTLTPSLNVRTGDILIFTSVSNAANMTMVGDAHETFVIRGSFHSSVNGYWHNVYTATVATTGSRSIYAGSTGAWGAYVLVLRGAIGFDTETPTVPAHVSNLNTWTEINTTGIKETILASYFRIGYQGQSIPSGAMTYAAPSSDPYDIPQWTCLAINCGVTSYFWGQPGTQINVSAGPHWLNASCPVVGTDFTGILLAFSMNHTPPAPTALHFTGIGPNRVGLQWTNPAGPLVNNTVVVFTGSGCPMLMTNISTGGVNTTRVVGGLQPLTLYSFAVLAWNASGGSPQSNCITNRTTAVLPGGGPPGWYPGRGPLPSPAGEPCVATSALGFDWSWTGVALLGLLAAAMFLRRSLYWILPGLGAILVAVAVAGIPATQQFLCVPMAASIALDPWWLASAGLATVAVVAYLKDSIWWLPPALLAVLFVVAL